MYSKGVSCLEQSPLLSHRSRGKPVAQPFKGDSRTHPKIRGKSFLGVGRRRAPSALPQGCSASPREHEGNIYYLV